MNDTAVITKGRKILICFDGSGNSPENNCPDEVENAEDKREDVNYTNVLKLHCLAGGSVNDKTPSYDGIPNDQISLYVRGVGENDDFWINKIFSRSFQLIYNTGANFFAGSIDISIKTMTEKLKNVIRPEDKLYIFGYSRGAATARKFACMISDDGFESNEGTIYPEIAFLGCFDTVSSQILNNLPELIIQLLFKKIPKTGILGEKDGFIGEKVQNAVHIVSLDDARMWRLYAPTLMCKKDGKHHEVWFPGIHGDVGGGYLRRGHGDNSLKYMMNWASTKLPVEDRLVFLEAEDLDEDALKSDEDKDKITKKSDLEMQICTEKDTHCYIDRKSHRLIYVSDKIQDLEVKIHVSVLEHLQKIETKEDYLLNPAMKGKTNFIVVGDDGEELEGKKEELIEEIKNYPWEKRDL